MTTGVWHLHWSDVDPARRHFDPALARAIAERHVLAAADGGTPPRPGWRVNINDVAEAMSHDLIDAYGAWAAGWCWSHTEGGPVRTWCCASHSLLRHDDGDATASIDRVMAALGEWRGFLVDLAARFTALRAAAPVVGVQRLTEHAAASLLPLVIERTAAEDSWYRTLAQVLSWYLEDIGVEVEQVRRAVLRVVSGRFQSACTPRPEEVTAAVAELGRAVDLADRDPEPLPVDDLASWLAIRHRLAAARPGAPSTERAGADGHRRFIEGAERRRDPQRAERMAAALDACRASAHRDQPLSFDLLASWQAIVLDQAEVSLRSSDAYAHDGADRYAWSPDLGARFDAALIDASGSDPASVRAARVFLDVCFFHPFADGNARAARLALDHVLTRARRVLRSAEPVFVVARSAHDADGALELASMLDFLTGPADG